MPNSLSTSRYLLTLLGLLLSLPTNLLAQIPETRTLEPQSREETTVSQAIEVFKSIDTLAIQGIPRELLRDAQAIAIIPGVIKGSLVIGVRRGHGVLLVRDEQARWGAPIFVTLTGGNIGWQIGVQSTDVLLVFKSRRSIDGIFNGKFTLGVDAAAAAGPLGRQAAAGTDSQLKAEIYSYSRSRGLFAGVSFDGSKIQIDPLANSEYYKQANNSASGNTPNQNIPQSAIDLVRLLSQATQSETNNSGASGNPNATPANALAPVNLPGHLQLDEAAAIRKQIQTIAPQLFDLLDPQWQQYLALPNELFAEESVANTEALKKALERYEMVRANPQYTPLASRKEFQTVHQLLKHYIAIEDKAPPSLILPPPPGGPAEP